MSNNKLDYAKIREMRGLIDAPEKWTRGTNARRADSERCVFDSKAAKCFCLQGAALRVGINPHGSDEASAILAEAGKLSIEKFGSHHDVPAEEMFDEMPDFNDDEVFSHSDMMTVLDRVIATETANV